MVQVGSSFFTVADPPLPAGAGPEAGPTIVWLSGEHDIATDCSLHLVLAHAIAANDAAVVIDLSDVELMCASTFGVIVAARKFLRQRSRSLTVRGPSARVLRIIRLLGLDDLIGPSGPATASGAGDALASWVGVPSAAPEILPEHDGEAAGPRTHAVVVERVADLALQGRPAVGGRE